MKALEYIVVPLLLANVLWFGSAFRLFWLKAHEASKLLVKKSDRNSPMNKTMIAALPFLGGMNLALSFLAVLLLIFLKDFSKPAHIFVYCTVFCVANASQFLGNLPIAKTERKTGNSLWPVLQGPMFFIFVVDLLLAILCGIVALLALTLILRP